MDKRILTPEFFLNSLRRDGLLYDWAVLLFLSRQQSQNPTLRTDTDKPKQAIFSYLIIRLLLGAGLLISLVRLGLNMDYINAVVLAVLTVLFALVCARLKRNFLAIASPLIKGYFERPDMKSDTLYQFTEFAAKDSGSVSFIDYMDLFEKIRFICVGGSFLLFVFIYPINSVKGFSSMFIAYLFCRFITFHLFGARISQVRIK